MTKNDIWIKDILPIAETRTSYYFINLLTLLCSKKGFLSKIGCQVVNTNFTLYSNPLFFKGMHLQWTFLPLGSNHRGAHIPLTMGGFLFQCSFLRAPFPTSWFAIIFKLNIGLKIQKHPFIRGPLASLLRCVPIDQISDTHTPKKV